MEAKLNIAELRLTEADRALPRPTGGRRKKRFIRGPIPLAWICSAAKQGGAALRVGLTLWYLRGLRNSPNVKLTTFALRPLNVSPRSKLRALQRLEAAGLVSVRRRTGVNPTVTILSADA
jgi:CRP-like cAMP-binding protein